MQPMLTTYPTASEFLARTQSILEEHEALNHVMIAAALQHQSPKPDVPTPYFATIHRGQALVLALVITPPNNVLLSAQADDSEAMQMMCQHLFDASWPVPGVHGPVNTVKQFVATWAALTGQPHHLMMNMGLYELREVISPTSVAGRLQLATMGYLSQVVEWLELFHDQALGEPISHEAAYELAKNKIGAKNLYLWAVDDEIVSMAAKARPISYGISVNLVYTPPEKRGRGYASACVATLSQSLLDHGYEFCTLFTDLTNPTSNSIYQKIGYKPVAEFQTYRFEPIA